MYYQRVAYLSDADGVKRFDAATTAWQPAGGPDRQALLTVAGDRLYASTEASGVQVFDGRRWATVEALNGHQHGGAAAGHAHGAALEAASGRVFALDRGIAAGNHAGSDFTALGGELPAPPRQVGALRGRLYAATAAGLFSYPLPPTDPAGASFWALIALLALSLGVTGSIITAFPRPLGKEEVEALRGANPTPA
ncbi:MAG: hypothetical protein NVS9B1_07820 [Candidatus Dormibacteraceae bacterium]